jgi:hypothetical protein
MKRLESWFNSMDMQSQLDVMVAGFCAVGGVVGVLIVWIGG